MLTTLFARASKSRAITVSDNDNPLILITIKTIMTKCCINLFYLITQRVLMVMVWQ